MELIANVKKFVALQKTSLERKKETKKEKGERKKEYGLGKHWKCIKSQVLLKCVGRIHYKRVEIHVFSA